jgi:hypothetical protein
MTVIPGIYKFEKNPESETGDQGGEYDRMRVGIRQQDEKKYQQQSQPVPVPVQERDQEQQQHAYAEIPRHHGICIKWQRRKNKKAFKP